MRTLKLQMQTSVDGFVAGPNSEMDWMTWDWDDELKNHIATFTEPIDCILLGRKMAKGFIDAWETRAADPQAAEWFAHKMNDLPKIVFSKTLQQIDWKNATLATGDLAEEIGRLKNQPGGDIVVYGGAGFVSSLIRENLIDDLHLFVNPAAIGQGLAIFKDRTKLKLAGARPFECGIVELHYVKTTA